MCTFNKTGGLPAMLKNQPRNRPRNEKMFEELLLQPVDSDGHYAALWFGDQGSHEMYIAGYENAANTLLKIVKRKGADNTIIYPIMMLLRHTIELGLKDIITQAFKLGGKAQTKEETIWTTHDLDLLSQTLIEAMRGIVTLEGSWSDIRKFLHKWELADPCGLFARYCRDYGGKIISIPKGRNISIQKLVGPAKQTIDYLYGLNEELHEMRISH